MRIGFPLGGGTLGKAASGASTVNPRPVDPQALASAARPALAIRHVLCAFARGTLYRQQTLRSFSLFAREVMPAFSGGVALARLVDSIRVDRMAHSTRGRTSRSTA